MTNCSLFNPLNFGSHATCMQKVALDLDRFFSFGCREVVVLQNQEGIVGPACSSTSWVRTAYIVSLVAGIVIASILELFSDILPVVISGTLLAIPLALFVAKVLLHLVYRNHVASLKPVEETLSIEIPVNFTEILQQKMPLLLQHSTDSDQRDQEGIHWIEDKKGFDHKESYRRIVFQLDAMPGKVLELQVDLSNNPVNAPMEKEVGNLYRLQMLCLQERFQHIQVCPLALHPLKYQDKDYSFLIREKENAQIQVKSSFLEREKYFIEDRRAEPVVRELVTFLIQSRMHLFWGNTDLHEGICRIRGTKNFDFELGRSAEFALYNFVAYLPPYLEQVAKEEAKKQGIVLEDEEIIKKRRSSFEHEEYDVYRFYQNKKILENPQQGIQLQQTEIDEIVGALPSTILTQILSAINNRISSFRDPQCALSLHRRIHLPVFQDAETEKAILQQLKDRGYIYQFQLGNKQNFTIQA